MNSSDREYEDLTAIKGIGPARQQWLREALDVHTIPQLAALSADEIESRLKAAGQLASRKEIEGWLDQAQEMAVAAEPASPQDIATIAEEPGGSVNDLANVDEPLPRDLEPENSETGKKERTLGEEDGWKPFASFVVEFQVRQQAGQAQERQTKVHYMEADKSETWPGLEAEQLCQWMLAQVTGKRKPEPKRDELPAEIKPALTPPVTVAVSRIGVFQPPQAQTPVGFAQAQQLFPGAIKGDEPFGLEVSFGLAGPTAADLIKKHPSYLAKFYVRSISTGAKLHLGDTQSDTLSEGKLNYTAVLPTATLTPGVYRLEALITFRDAPIGPGYLEVPMLQVV